MARARIVTWEGASLWIIDAAPKGVQLRRTDFHAHHAIQTTLGLGGRFRLDTADAHAEGEAVVVAADIRHVFEAEGLVAHLFVEPESKAGGGMEELWLKGLPLAAISTEALGDIRVRLTANFEAKLRDDAALASLGKELVAALGSGVAPETPDPRIHKVVEWVAGAIEGPISLSDAAAVSCLSASRLRHLFVEQTGLPFKVYVLWVRLKRAVDAFAAGAPLTQAAHDAGFSDSAHLSRTFRRMFGVAPTSLRLV